MKALSIRQPWAWAIIHAGKDVENRSWKPNSPAMHQAWDIIKRGERILIHAAQGMARQEYDDFAMFARDKLPDHVELPCIQDLKRGGIIGSAKLTGISYQPASKWFMGELGLMLHFPESRPFRPYAGKLGFFEVPPDYPPVGEITR